MDRTPAQYDAAAGHVAYELDQLVQMSRWLRSPTLPPALRNACLESLLIHARALAYFLVVKRDRPSDLNRDDFVASWSWTPNEATERLLEALPVINKHLAHLTWERVEQGEQPWVYPTVAADVVQVFTEFVQQVSAQDNHGLTILADALTRAKADLPDPVAAIVSTTTSSRE